MSFWITIGMIGFLAASAAGMRSAVRHKQARISKKAVQMGYELEF